MCGREPPCRGRCREVGANSFGHEVVPAGSAHCLNRLQSASCARVDSRTIAEHASHCGSQPNRQCKPTD